MDKETKKQKHSDPRLLEFRNQYGKVARVSVADTVVYIRGLFFEEWVKINREVKINVTSDGMMNYDLDQKSIQQYIVPCVLDPVPLPDTITSKPVNMNLISTTVLNITDFDNSEVLLEKYKKALARQQLMATEIKRQLVLTYGLDVLQYLKKATVDDTMELIAMGEWIRQDLGQFAHSLGVTNLLPITPTGKMNKDKLLELLQSWLFEETETPQTKEETPKKPDHVFDVKKFISDVKPKKQETTQPKPKQASKGKLTISQINSKKVTEGLHDVSRLKEPRLYNADPSSMSPELQRRNKVEFEGNLINLWNENMATLHEKIQEDAKNPTKFASLEDIQKEDDKSNVVLNPEQGKK